MRPLWGLLVLLLAAGSAVPADTSEQTAVRHQLTVALEPSTAWLTVQDRVTLPETPVARVGLEFVLNSALEIAPGPSFEAVGEPFAADRFVLNDDSITRGSAAIVRRYRIVELPDDRTITLSYSGPIAFGLSDEAEEYTRGFRETIGSIGEEGLYLAADSFWYPYFDDGLLAYEMTVEQPAGWHVIAAGKGESRGDDGRARWESEGASDEIYLTGGPLRVYGEAAGGVDAWVYLREDDPSLADSYLTATAQYLEMYRQLIGPYPYSKFALVENFWETGYGMPSFTLLGPRVIRFPFILHSSYPHEILHNWWGNGVFVDYSTGNWCEGLTAYLADHLVQEQRGRGEAYRRDTLQKYRNYVDGHRDFPLAEFRSRHDAATEAVGYGKSLMGFHMLRETLGDEKFRDALADFYRRNRGRRATFRDLQQAFESASAMELGPFFDQWLDRTGAAALVVTAETSADGQSGHRVHGTLEQIQSDEPFVVDVPIVIDTVTGPERHTVRSASRRTEFDLPATARPLRIRVDPAFDLFRMLDPREMPPSIGQLFGESAILAVLPSAASPGRVEQYRELVEGWRSDSHAIEIVTDVELTELPDDRSVWLLGHENRFLNRTFVDDELTGFSMAPSTATFMAESVPLEGHSWVAVRRHPRSVERAIGLLVVDPPAAFAGIGRKLPHYGKYSYLAFTGEAPDNVIKGQWATDDSPLVVDLRPDGARDAPTVFVPDEPRRALAELPPVFSQKSLAEHVAFLASPELEGRGVGGPGLALAADYIAERFRALGLQPAGDDGTFLQRFELADGPDGQPQRVANVLGYLPGKRSEWAGQSVIVSAHYDHLGRGWPDVYQGNEGKIHPGADDNASGVAVLLELAGSFAAAELPDRTLVFAAFTAEESGRLGSIHFVEHHGRFPLDQIRGVINLDTVGRLGDGKISVLATGTADEWQHIFRGVGFVTGIDSRNVAQSLEASDQMTFIEQGVPAVQIFTEAHADYHRPTDTADRVDAAGLVRVATFVKEALVYMVQREEPMTVTIDGAAAKRAATPRDASSGRKVSFGTVPEFGFAGPGVQVASLVPRSPAESAGIRAGDVLTRIDDHEITDLRGFSDVLKTLQPGQSVQATLVRDGERMTVTVTVTAR